MADRQPSSRACFVCGRENAGGLRARWVGHADAGEVRARVRIPEHFAGYPGVVHGGVVSALLDEAMVRTALLDGGFDDLMVTARMEVTFRRPTPTATDVVVVGRGLRRSGRRATARAELLLPDGAVAATAEGTLMQPAPDVAAAWAAERGAWKVTDE